MNHHKDLGTSFPVYAKQRLRSPQNGGFLTLVRGLMLGLISQALLTEGWY